MIFRILLLLAILCTGCISASKTARMEAIAEDNKDVVVLSYLIRDHLRKTNDDHFSLADIVKGDTLGRIKNNFTALEIGSLPGIWIGGYIVYFKFAEGRNKQDIQLKSHERIPWKVTTKKEIGQSDAQIARHYDGEIHFYYQERFYHIKAIIVKPPMTTDY
jgi:hypothetical protein